MILNLITPEKIIFSGKISSITLPSILGQITILPNHAPLISALQKGKVKIVKEDGQEIFLDIEAGVVQVAENEVNVLLS